MIPGFISSINKLKLQNNISKIKVLIPIHKNNLSKIEFIIKKINFFMGKKSEIFTQTIIENIINNDPIKDIIKLNDNIDIKSLLFMDINSNKTKELYTNICVTNVDNLEDNYIYYLNNGSYFKSFNGKITNNLSNIYYIYIEL